MRTASDHAGAFVLKGEYGKCYEIKIPAGHKTVFAFSTMADPRFTDVTVYAENILCDSHTGEAAAFMYTCRRMGESLVVYTGSRDPFYIGERTILAKNDTTDSWYIPEPESGIEKEYTRDSETFFNQCYEPLRRAYPDYITREVIGRDASGQYHMYGYIFAPENYQITMFLTGGMHASEEVGYHALARVLALWQPPLPP